MKALFGVRAFEALAVGGLCGYFVRVLDTIASRLGLSVARIAMAIFRIQKQCCLVCSKGIEQLQ